MKLFHLFDVLVGEDAPTERAPRTSDAMSDENNIVDDGDNDADARLQDCAKVLDRGGR